MATNKTVSKTTTNKAANAGPTIKVDITVPAAVAALKRESARSRTITLAQKFNGKPLADFKKAWVDQALAIHGPNSKFTQRGQAQQFSGWLSWLVRNGVVVVNK